MWYPGGEVETGQAVVRSIYESFPYVRCFRSVERWGIHLLASAEPIEQLDADQFVARMPLSARKDLVEWNDSQDDLAYVKLMLSNEIPIPRQLNPDAKVQITDDQPYNEYFCCAGRVFDRKLDGHLMVRTNRNKLFQEAWHAD